MKSGRNKNRPGLQKLLKLCDEGRIDMIIMKSMSRFMRNTVDALVIIRLLRSINVDIFFENEHIHTLTEKSEMEETIFAALFQLEGSNISENVKWGIDKSVRKSESKYFSRVCYGYRLSADSLSLVKKEDEAEVVRLIYKFSKAGMGVRRIRTELRKRGIVSPQGKPEWSQHTIQRILSNEKYRGDVLFYKHYCQEYPGNRRILNKGQHVQYLAVKHHAPIITDDVQDCVDETI